MIMTRAKIQRITLGKAQSGYAAALAIMLLAVLAFSSVSLAAPGEVDCRNGCDVDVDEFFEWIEVAPALADEMSNDDLCWRAVNMAEIAWGTYQYMWWSYWHATPPSTPRAPTINDSYASVSLMRDDGSLYQDSIDCKASSNLDAYAIRLLWAGDLKQRELETAVLKRCRSLPRKALVHYQTGILCNTQYDQSLAEQYAEQLRRELQLKQLSLGKAMQHFLDLIKQSKAGADVGQVVMTEAYWAMVDEINDADVRASIEAARE